MFGRKIVSAIASASVLLAVFGTTALADPGNGAKQEVFPLTCGGKEIEVIVPPGQWGVGHIVGQKGALLVPIALEIEVKDPGTGTVLFSDVMTKPGHKNQDTMICTSTFTDVDPHTGLSVELDLTVTVMTRPKA